MPGQITKENLQDSLTYHQPNAEQQKVINEIRALLIEIGNKVLDRVPIGADRERALATMRDFRLQVEQAIYLNGLV